MLHIEDLHKSYGDVTALRGVGLEVSSGQIVGLLGPNGAGKTTLISIVCGLRRADRGVVFVDGVDAKAHPQRVRRQIGFAPQETGIYPLVTARDNLRLFAELRGMTGREARRETERLATALQLCDFLDRKAGELSGGQKRRLHTAIALIDDPPLVLLDEATTGADVETRASLLELVQALAAKGAAVLYSTHYLHEVEMLGADVVILDQGSVIAAGPVPDLISDLGCGFVEVMFDGSPPPSKVGELTVTVEGDRARITARDPGRAVAATMEALGTNGTTVESVEVVRPSLETVYLALTGRRFRIEEDQDVVAS
jgi:ABC-2 type transport system ATP-binding protein